MRLLRFFKSKQGRFFELITQQSMLTVEGLQTLEEYMKDASQQAANNVQRLEREADELRRVLIEELNRSFVTPIDREDLFALSRTIDDILDYAYSTVDEMVILDLKPNPYLQKMASILREAAEELHLSIVQLKKYPQIALEHATKAKAFENQMEAVYREALAALFKGPKDLDHVIEMLKTREVYRHLSNAADRGDETANIIGNIVVKMT